jgi:hypothetical protein
MTARGARGAEEARLLLRRMHEKVHVKQGAKGPSCSRGVGSAPPVTRLRHA